MYVYLEMWYLDLLTFNLQKIHDWILALAVLALVIIDKVIIGLYLIVEGVRGHLIVEKVPNRDYPEETTGVSSPRYYYTSIQYILWPSSGVWSELFIRRSACLPVDDSVILEYGVYVTAS